MPAAEVFFDTNILLYLLSPDAAKADRAEALVDRGGVISVQVLNEFASVATRKLSMRVPEVRGILSTVRTLCDVVPLSTETHDLALDFAERYHLSFFDALIVAAAVLAECRTLYSEDMQHGQKIEGLTIRNPFVGQ
jgi:predicted nucleic acid-binding protein